MKKDLNFADILAAIGEGSASITELVKMLSPQGDDRVRKILADKIKALVQTKEAQPHVGLATEKTTYMKSSYYATVIYSNPDTAAYSRQRVEKLDPEAYAKFAARTAPMEPETQNRRAPSVDPETLARIEANMARMEALLIRIADVLELK